MSYKIDYNYNDYSISGADFNQLLLSGEFRGIVSNMPNDVYHGAVTHRYTSSTRLKYLYSKSPMHYKAKYIDVALENVEASKSMILGSAFHSKVLTPELFEDEFFVVEKLDLRRNEDKLKKEFYESQIVGRIVITDDIALAASCMADGVLNSKKSKHLLDGTDRELAFFWKCPFSGILFRSKVDALDDENLLELKSAVDASPKGFERAAYNLNYDLSLAHYIEGVRVLTGKTLKPYFIVAENEHPYVVQNYVASDDFLTLGHEKWLEAVNTLDDALTNNKWHGYVEDDPDVWTVLNPPSWTMKKLTISDTSTDTEELY